MRRRQRQQGTLFDRGEAAWPPRHSRAYTGLRAAQWVATGAATDLPSRDQRDARVRFDNAVLIAEDMGLVRFSYRSMPDGERRIDEVVLTERGARALDDLGVYRFDREDWETNGPPSVEWSPWVPSTPAPSRSVRSPTRTSLRMTPSPRRSRTFEAARRAILDELALRRWQLSDRGLKVPHATSPSGEVRLWFKPQAVWFTEGRHHADHPFSHARSANLPDIREVEAIDFVDDVQRRFPRWR